MVLQLLEEAAYHRLLIVVVSWLKNILSIVLEASTYMVRYVWNTALHKQSYVIWLPQNI